MYPVIFNSDLFKTEFKSGICLLIYEKYSLQKGELGIPMEWGAENVPSLLVLIGYIQNVWEEAVVKAGFYVPGILTT